MHCIICLNCSKEYVAKRASSKYCSINCKSQYYRKNNKVNKVCSHCKEDYVGSPKNKFCSFECSTKSKKKEKALRDLIKTINKISCRRKCPHCKEWFIVTTHDKMYCTKKCYLKQRYLESKKQKTKNKVCEECGSGFETSDTRMNCCSKECSNKRSWRNAYLKRKRRVKENGKFEPDISVSGLIDRDGDKCYLCGTEIDHEVNYTEPKYPTIDHVVPISKGGTHTWDNVKLAHRRCNSKKSDKILTLTK